MTRNLQLALVLVATLTASLANTVTEPDVQLDVPGTEVDFSIRERRQVTFGEALKCGHRFYMQVKNCCGLPELIPQSAMKNCSGGRGPPPMNGTTGAARIRQLANNTREIGQMARDTMKMMKGGPACFVECMFKNQSWVSSTGDLIYATIETYFLSVSNATWQPLVKTAISNCTAQIQASSGTSSTSASGGKTCNNKPVQFMMCITQILVLNCPAALKAQGTTCSRDVATLATCNPMNVQTLATAARNMRLPVG